MLHREQLVRWDAFLEEVVEYGSISIFKQELDGCMDSNTLISVRSKSMTPGWGQQRIRFLIMLPPPPPKIG